LFFILFLIFQNASAPKTKPAIKKAGNLWGDVSIEAERKRLILFFGDFSPFIKKAICFYGAIAPADYSIISPSPFPRNPICSDIKYRYLISLQIIIDKSN